MIGREYSSAKTFSWSHSCVCSHQWWSKIEDEKWIWGKFWKSSKVIEIKFLVVLELVRFGTAFWSLKVGEIGFLISTQKFMEIEFEAVCGTDSYFISNSYISHPPLKHFCPPFIPPKSSSSGGARPREVKLDFSCRAQQFGFRECCGIQRQQLHPEAKHVFHKSRNLVADNVIKHQNGPHSPHAPNAECHHLKFNLDPAGNDAV